MDNWIRNLNFSSTHCAGHPPLHTTCNIIAKRLTKTELFLKNKMGIIHQIRCQKTGMEVAK